MVYLVPSFSGWASEKEGIKMNCILDNMDNPEIDFAGEREHSEGKIQSDDN